MKYITSFTLFEGLFSSNESDDEVVKDIMTKLSTLEFTPEFNKGKGEFIIKDIKLDENEGIYTLVINITGITLYYFKKDKLQFKKELISKYKTELFDLINKRLKY